MCTRERGRTPLLARRRRTSNRQVFPSFFVPLSSGPTYVHSTREERTRNTTLGTRCARSTTGRRRIAGSFYEKRNAPPRQPIPVPIRTTVRKQRPEYTDHSLCSSRLLANQYPSTVPTLLRGFFSSPGGVNLATHDPACRSTVRHRTNRSRANSYPDRSNGVHSRTRDDLIGHRLVSRIGFGTESFAGPTTRSIPLSVE